MTKTDLIVRLLGDDKLNPTIDNVKKALKDTGKQTTVLEGIREKFE